MSKAGEKIVAGLNDALAFAQGDTSRATIVRVSTQECPETAEEYKIWLAIRADLDMPPGKLAAQAGHAFMGIAIGASPDNLGWKKYLDGATPKIAVSVPGEDALLQVRIAAAKHRIPHYLVCDAGRTCFSEPTYTVCAFGPCLRSELPPYLKRLRLYE